MSRNKTNIAPIAWISPLNDDPPLVIICVATSHYTAELIDQTKEFVINIVGKDLPSISKCLVVQGENDSPADEVRGLLKAIKTCGSISGRKTDKYKKANLTKLKSKKIDVPYIEKSIGHVECKVIESKEYSGVTLFVGKVLYCEVEEEFYDGYLITEKAQTPHHVGGGYFIISPKRTKW